MFEGLTDVQWLFLNTFEEHMEEWISYNQQPVTGIILNRFPEVVALIEHLDFPEHITESLLRAAHAMLIGNEIDHDYCSN